MRYPIGTTIIFRDRVFGIEDKLEIEAYVITDTGTIKYLIHDPKSEYDCMYDKMSERELADKIKEQEEILEKKLIINIPENKPWEI